MNPCSRQADLQRYHDGELPAPAAAELEAHLAACPDCARELAELRALAQRWQALAWPQWPAAARRRAHQRIDRAGEPALVRLAGSLTAAAAAVLIACSMQLAWFGRSESPRLLSDASWELVALTPPSDDAPAFGDAQVALDRRGSRRRAGWTGQPPRTDFAHGATMSLTRAIVLASFLLAFAAGISVGLVLAGGRAIGSDAMATTRPAHGGPGNRGRDRDGSFLAKELNLTPAQQEQMKKIWSEVGQDGWRGEERRRALAKERDEMIQALIPADQRAGLQKVLDDYKRQADDLSAERHRIFQQAVDKTKVILDESQRRKYDEFLLRRGAGRRGHDGPATAPGTAPAALP